MKIKIDYIRYIISHFWSNFFDYVLFYPLATFRLFIVWTAKFLRQNKFCFYHQGNNISRFFWRKGTLIELILCYLLLWPFHRYVQTWLIIQFYHRSKLCEGNLQNIINHWNLHTSCSTNIDYKLISELIFKQYFQPIIKKWIHSCFINHAKSESNIINKNQTMLILTSILMLIIYAIDQK